MKDYEIFEHGADVGVRGFGESAAQAMANAAKAMFSVMIDLARIQAKQEILVETSGDDPELLFINWLNELLATAHLQRMVFCEFEVQILGNRLIGRARGEALDLVKHEPTVEVKGATFAACKVAKENNRYLAQCVVDV